jgi:hypothetical protein
LTDATQIQARATAWSRANSLDISQLTPPQRQAAVDAVAAEVGVSPAAVAEALVAVWAGVNEARGSHAQAAIGAVAHRPTGATTGGRSDALRVRLEQMIDPKANRLSGGLSPRMRDHVTAPLDVEAVYRRAPLTQAALLEPTTAAQALLSQHTAADGSLALQHLEAAIRAAPDGAARTVLVAVRTFFADADGAAPAVVAASQVAAAQGALAAARGALDSVASDHPGAGGTVTFPAAATALNLHDPRIDTVTNAVGATHSNFRGTAVAIDGKVPVALLKHAAIAAPLADHFDQIHDHLRVVYSEVAARTRWLDTVVDRVWVLAATGDGRQALTLHFVQAAMKGELPHIDDAVRTMRKELAAADTNVFTRVLRSSGSLSSEEVRAFLKTDSLATFIADVKASLNLNPNEPVSTLAEPIQQWRLAADLFSGGINYIGIADGTA